ncbi:IS66 family transposase, partial [Corallococcus sp. CA054B]
MPLHRLAQRVERGGVPMSRSTLTDLFHQSASVLLPLSQHLLRVIASADVVWADETPVRVLDVKKTRQGYLWTFLTQTAQGEWLLGYRFSLGRASTTPKEVLGGTQGALVVDAYTGYNAVTLPEGRLRVGCWAHVRRRFFEALSTAPEAREALDFILALYRVEALAREAGVVRTDAHRELRQQQSLPVLSALRAWMEAQTPRHLPKGPMGQALSYALKQWYALTRFGSDARLPWTTTAPRRRCARPPWAVKTFSSSATRPLGRTSPASTRWSPPARPTASIPRRTSRTCCCASSRTRMRASANCCPTSGCGDAPRTRP